jgi:peptide/nickel transport system substrate-binding protein
MSKRPGGQPNAAGLDDPVIDKNLTLAAEQKEEKDQHAYLRKMMDQAVSQAYFLFWMHDLNLRVMSADVKNFVEPQSWWVDFSKITVTGN